MKKGFTLAEVLITLGIIGVVAALTIPTLISDYQKRQYETGFLKTYNTLINGYKMYLAESYCTDNTCSTIPKLYLDAMTNDNYTALDNLYNKYFKVLKICKKSEYTQCAGTEYYDWQDNELDMASNVDRIYSVAFADGSSYTAINGMYCALITILDTNGPKEPNKLGYDAHMFIIDWCNNEKELIFPYGDSRVNPSSWFGTWQDHPEMCGKSGEKIKDSDNATGHGCAARILEEGFKIKYY